MKMITNPAKVITKSEVKGTPRAWEVSTKTVDLVCRVGTSSPGCSLAVFVSECKILEHPVGSILLSIRMITERIYTEDASSKRSHAVTDLPNARTGHRPRVSISLVGHLSHRKAFSFLGGSHCRLVALSTPVGNVTDHLLCRMVSVAASCE